MTADYVPATLSSFLPVHEPDLIARCMKANSKTEATRLLRAASTVAASSEQRPRVTKPNSKAHEYVKSEVPRDGIERPTRGFSSRPRGAKTARNQKWLRLLKG